MCRRWRSPRSSGGRWIDRGPVRDSGRTRRTPGWRPSRSYVRMLRRTDLRSDMRADRLAGLKTLAAFALATMILVAAGAYAAAGDWPWRRPGPTPLPPVAVLFSERLDTLRRGESVSQLFARQGLGDFVLAPEATGGLFEPRRLRAGLVFSFQRRGDDSIPSRVYFRSSPEQRVALIRADGGWHPVAEPIRWTSEPVVL